MSSNPSKRLRTPRVSRLDLPPGLIEATFDRLQQRDVLLRLALCVVAALIMWVVTGAGKSPFPYRLNDIPARNIVVRYPFSKVDLDKTNQQRDAARLQARAVYNNNQEMLVNLREELKNKVVTLTQSQQLADDKLQAMWLEFRPPGTVAPAAPPLAAPAVKTPPAAQPPTNSAGQPATPHPSATQANPVVSPNGGAPSSAAPAPHGTAPSKGAAPGDSLQRAAPTAAKSAASYVGLGPAEFEFVALQADPASPAAPQAAPATKTDPAASAPSDKPTEGTAAKTPEKSDQPANTSTAPKPVDAANEAKAAAPNPPQASDADAHPPVPKPEGLKSEAVKPDTVKPDTAKPDAGKPPVAPPVAPPLTPEQKLFEDFRAALGTKESIDDFKKVVDDLFTPLIKHGLIDALPANHTGNQKDIRVRVSGNDSSVFQVNEVLQGEILPTVKQSLFTKVQSKIVAELTNEWLNKRLDETSTLTLDDNATAAAKEEAAAAVPDVSITYRLGDLLAPGGAPISADSLALLRLEHESASAQPSLSDRFIRSVAVLGMFTALFTLCGFYMVFREPRLIANLPRFSLMLAMVTLTTLLAYGVASELRAEIIPIMLFGMTMAIAYQQELAMLTSAAVALAVVFLAGFSLPSFVVLTATVSVAVLLLGRIRSRRKLIYVGLTAAVVSMLTSLGVNTLTSPTPSSTAAMTAAWCGLWGLVAAFLMTGLLPFIENLFGVQTDLSLIELGDVAHPLLQELVRRAPGTYNHSIMVASIGEAAAEAIGAHGLLVRVGAYFHDIGKMLKPGYFVENQGISGNRHEDLVPAMSTLIIIAHVKDGADLARQHHLPQPIIDFIQQHHGTTLVEYFYGRAAAEQRTQNPDRPVDENSFRYPGPKPQTKEAAVLMLADAVESASRTLVEPAPARIEGLVSEIAMKRLLDGQFDACGLTLQELHTMEESLVKSLIAVYHGRVKYPDQRTA
jgi:putative nucleotidyltransferase with HDIG domain